MRRVMYLGHHSIQLIVDVVTQHALFEEFCPEFGQNSIFVCYMMAGNVSSSQLYAFPPSSWW